MKKVLCAIVCFVLLTFSSVFADGMEFDDEGNLIPDTTTRMLFFFPDVGVGSAFDIPTRRVITTLNIEILDTDDSKNIIPLKVKSLPPMLDVIGDVAVGEGLVMIGVGVRFLPILEPGVLLFFGYNFDNGAPAYGASVRFGVKF